MISTFMPPSTRLAFVAAHNCIMSLRKGLRCSFNYDIGLLFLWWPVVAPWIYMVIFIPTIAILCRSVSSTTWSCNIQQMILNKFQHPKVFQNRFTVAVLWWKGERCLSVERTTKVGPCHLTLERWQRCIVVHDILLLMRESQCSHDRQMMVQGYEQTCDSEASKCGGKTIAQTALFGQKHVFLPKNSDQSVPMEKLCYRRWLPIQQHGHQ
jgi:hypothetical protein